MKKRAAEAAAAYEAAWDSGAGSHHPDFDPDAAAAGSPRATRPTEELYNAIVADDVDAVYAALEAGADTLLMDEDTSASNLLARDARITTIYEGTTAIQANDLVGRKTARDGGQTAKGIAAQIETTPNEISSTSQLPPLGLQ